MIYIASPFFNEKERTIYQEIINLVKQTFPTEEIFIPAEHSIPNAWELSNADWGKRVFEADVQALDKSNKVVVINWGMYSDTGTAWECGYAYAKEKQVYCVCVGDQADMSLMMINGCTMAINKEQYEQK